MNPISNAPATADSADQRAPLPRLAAGALAGLSLAVLLSTVNTSIVNAALPVLMEVFAVSMPSVQWIVIAFILAITALIVSAGRLADLFGHKRVVLAGVAMFTMAGVACGLAPGLEWLVAARFFQGLGAAVMMAVSLAVISQRGAGASGRAIGLLGTMSAIGTALGPVAGGLLIAAFGWRAIFLVNLPLGLVTFALLRRTLPADERARDVRVTEFDWRGTALLALSLVSYALGVTRREDGFNSTNAFLLILAGAAMVLFVLVQRRTASPLVQVELLRNRSLRTSLTMTALVAAVMMATLVVGPFYLSRALHLSPATIGAVLSVGPLTAALTAWPAGRWVERLGTHVMTVAGLMVAAVGCVALVFVPEACGPAGFAVAVAVMTSGYALFQTANNTAVMHVAAPVQRGLVSGLLNLARNAGLLTGASVLGAVFAFAIGHAGNDAASVALSMRLTFGVAAAFILVALVLALRALRSSPAARRAALRSFRSAQTSPACGRELAEASGP